MPKIAAAALAVCLFAGPALADYGTGCPMFAFAGMKAFEDANGNQIPHQGQWFTAVYSNGSCGMDESDVTWTVTPEPAVSDVCFGAYDYVLTQAAGDKRCKREHGKIFWLPPGTYTLTAHSPGDEGTWTIEDFVVD